MTGGSPRTVGFVGLGVMGEAQCGNLLAKSGLRVVVHDVRREAVDRLVAQGAQAAEQHADVARDCDVVFLSLPSAVEVESVVLGEGGLLASAASGTILVDLSTSTVDLAQRIGGQAQADGVWFLDAPVTRTRQAAIEGRLSVTVGGDPDIFARVEPLLRTMATDVLHCGPNGAGALLKLINNMVVFESVVALAEALTLVRRTGLVDETTAFEALANGSAASFVLENHGRKALLPDVHPEGAFPSAYMRKDLAYGLAAADEVGLRLPAARLAAELLDRTCDAGFEKAYHTAVVRIIEAAGDEHRSESAKE